MTAPPRPNAAIFILTQNSDVRRTHLKTCLYFLFKHGNATHQYPVIIMHEGDYDADAQREILMSVRTSCRSLVTFRALDAGDFTIPSHIDASKMDRCIATRPVPYWRNAKYRMMCRWWLVHFPRYAQGYEYVMRLDDDSIIEEPIPDLFAWARDRQLVYASNMLHADCPLCCYGMKQFFADKFPDKQAVLDEAFLPSKLPMRSPQLHAFRALLSITQRPLPQLGETLDAHMPLMWYNNMFVTKTDFWQRPDVKNLIKDIDDNGSIFYYRWGDAPLQTLIVLLLAQQDQVSRAVFKYSKRMQREAFRDDSGQLHSYMPATYDRSSCITEERAGGTN